MLIMFLLLWLITAFGLWLVTLIVPGIRAESGGDLMLAALVLGFINAFIRPLLVILTRPHNISCSAALCAFAARRRNAAVALLQPVSTTQSAGAHSAACLLKTMS